MSAPEMELHQLVELPFAPPPLDTGVYAQGGATADAGTGFFSPATAGADSVPTWIPYERHMPTISDKEVAIISATINILPGVGVVKSGLEALVGRDLLTGRKLENWEIALNLASAIPMAGQAAKAIMVAREITLTVRAAKIVHVAVEVGEVAHGVNTGVHYEHLVDELTGGGHGGEHGGGGSAEHGGGGSAEHGKH